MPSRQPEEIAQRLNDYADQVTKFVLLQALAFVISLSNPAVMNLISKIPSAPLYFLWTIVNFVEIAFVVCCHPGEDALIGKAMVGNAVDPWRRFIRFARWR